jgi:hypothetical protein
MKLPASTSGQYISSPLALSIAMPSRAQNSIRKARKLQGHFKAADAAGEHQEMLLTAVRMAKSQTRTITPA